MNVTDLQIEITKMFGQYGKEVDNHGFQIAAYHEILCNHDEYLVIKKIRELRTYSKSAFLPSVGEILDGITITPKDEINIQWTHVLKRITDGTWRFCEEGDITRLVVDSIGPGRLESCPASGWEFLLKECKEKFEFIYKTKGASPTGHYKQLDEGISSNEALHPGIIKFLEKIEGDI